MNGGPPLTTEVSELTGDTGDPPPRRVSPFAGMMSLCQVGKSGESHVRRSLRRRDRGLYRQSDQLLNGCDGL